MHKEKALTVLTQKAVWKAELPCPLILMTSAIVRIDGIISRGLRTPSSVIFEPGSEQSSQNPPTPLRPKDSGDGPKQVSESVEKLSTAWTDDNGEDDEEEERRSLHVVAGKKILSVAETERPRTST